MKLKSQFTSRSKKTKILNLKCTDDEISEMKKNAELFSGGNLSAWIRFASIKLRPSKKFLE
jgi:hypothetical protein